MPPTNYRPAKKSNPTRPFPQVGSAAHYTNLAQWQVAIEALILMARSGPTMLARIAFMKALDRNVVLAFNPDVKKHHGGKRKLKSDQ